jgi:hypothetical protein
LIEGVTTMAVAAKNATLGNLFVNTLLAAIAGNSRYSTGLG